MRIAHSNLTIVVIFSTQTIVTSHIAHQLPDRESFKHDRLFGNSSLGNHSVEILIEAFWLDTDQSLQLLQTHLMIHFQMNSGF